MSAVVNTGAASAASTVVRLSTADRAPIVNPSLTAAALAERGIRRLPIEGDAKPRPGIVRTPELALLICLLRASPEAQRRTAMDWVLQLHAINPDCEATGQAAWIAREILEGVA
ncbi:MAG TPA: hypothetical protein VF636_04460 [Sphingomonas sp.]|jgi:hypothetical protein